VGAACVLGVLFSLALARLLHGPLPADLFATAAPWMKLTYTGLLALAAAWLVARAARPVSRLRAPTNAVAAVVLVMGAFSIAVTWLFMAPGERMGAVMGRTWMVCPWTVLALSLPTLGLLMRAVRGLAPTRLRMAGFASGLLAGAIAALAYSLACPERSAAFVAVWYTLGILLAGGLGAALGARTLRW
jgi:hypothetical protein